MNIKKTNPASPQPKASAEENIPYPYTNGHYLKKELYELVRTSPKVFDFLQAGSLDGIWYWDLEHPDNEWLSPRFKEVFGYRDDEVPNTSMWWKQNIFPEDLKIVIGNFEKHCIDENHPYDQVVRYRHKDETTIWIRCRGLAIRNSNGKPVRMLGAHTDITALKRAEEQLQWSYDRLEARVAERTAELERAISELKRSNKLLEEFTYVASHDLRSPLRAIRNIAKWLEEDLEGVLQGETKENLTLLRRRVERMDNLLIGLLEYSRAGRDKSPAEDVDAAELVNDISRSVVNSGKIKIDLQGTFPRLKTARASLEHVLTHLICNAIKHHDHEDDGHVILSIQDCGDFYQFSVADDGPGIPPEHRERIFEIFQTLRPKDEVESTGIGLSLVRHYVNTAGGEVYVEQNRPRGTIFRFTWKKQWE